MFRLYRLILLVACINGNVRAYYNYYDKLSDNPSISSYDSSIGRITVPPFYGNEDTNFDNNGAPVDSNDETDHTPKAEYSFSYGVDDPETGNSHGRYETRDGDVVQGQYSLIEPDGFLRKVYYTSDPRNGFRATVEYVPPAEETTAQNSHHFNFDRITFPSSSSSVVDREEFPSSLDKKLSSYSDNGLTSHSSFSSPEDDYVPEPVDVPDVSPYSYNGNRVTPYSHHYQFNRHPDQRENVPLIVNNDPISPAPVTHESDYDYVQNTDRTTTAVNENNIGHTPAVNNEYDDGNISENDEYGGISSPEPTHPFKFYDNEQEQEEPDEENDQNNESASLERTNGRPPSFIRNNNNNNNHHHRHPHYRNNNNHHHHHNFNIYNGAENRKVDTNVEDGPDSRQPKIKSEHRRQKSESLSDSEHDDEDDVVFPPMHPLAKPVDVVVAPEIDLEINDEDTTSHLIDDEIDDE